MTIKAYSYVRLSSRGQVEGGGERRQIEMAYKYAAEHGLDLDDSLRDLGKSGYHGEHIRTGALGRFLELVATGKIARGSLLLVENLDRLSRQTPIDAQENFIAILQTGIKIVTLADGQVYERGRDFTQLIIALTIMSRGHEESQIKHVRAKRAVDDRKQDALKGLPRFNNSLVHWIDQERVSGFDYKFSLNEHAKTVQRIFELADQGLGTVGIARILNETETPRFTQQGNDKTKWRDIQVNRILKNEIAIGTYRVTENVDGVDVLMGEPVKNYYPAAVSEELFWRVQRNRKAAPKKGRIGKTFTNLFQDLTECSVCGSRMKMHNGNPRGGTRMRYYTCMNRYMGGGCESPSKLFPYDAFETSVLNHVTEFHLDSRLGLSKTKANRDAIAAEHKEAVVALENLQRRQSNLLAMAEMADDDETRAELLVKMKTFRNQIEQQRAMVSELADQLGSIDDASKEISDVSERIHLARLSWTTASEGDVLASRASVARALKEFISRIVVDLKHQYALVYVAGYTRVYQFDRNGGLVSVMNGADRPFEIVEKVMLLDKVDEKKIAQAKAAYAKIKAAG